MENEKEKKNQSEPTVPDLIVSRRCQKIKSRDKINESFQHTVQLEKRASLYSPRHDCQTPIISEYQVRTLPDNET